MKTQYDPNLMEDRAIAAIDNVPLSAAELGSLWNTYMQYSLFVCVFKHFHKTTEDFEIRPLVEDALQICSLRVKQASDILQREGLPIPKGFKDEDVDLKAPKLFSDPYYLYYIINANKIALAINSLSLVTSGRADVRDFYEHCINSSMHLYNNTVNLLLSKGLYIRPPIVTIAKGADYVKRQDFLSGFLGEKRSLLAQEISNLFYSITTNNIGKRLLMGFQQTTASEQVRNYMSRGISLADELIDAFRSIMLHEDVSVAAHWDDMVNESTVPPFSNRLMMYHSILISSASISSYVTASIYSPRHDLNAIYTWAAAKIATFIENGINIMIDNGWYEEPYRMVDRRKLENQSETAPTPGEAISSLTQVC